MRNLSTKLRLLTLNQEVFPPERLPALRALIEGKISKENLIIERPDGSQIIVTASAKPIRDIAGQITAAIGIFEDITSNKKKEEAFKKSEAHFRSVLENSLDVIYRFNLQTSRYEYMSPSIRHLGFEPEEMIGMTNAEVLSRVHPDDLSALKADMARCGETGTCYSEYRFVGKDGVYRWWSNQMILSRDENGQPLYRDGFVRDISERKKAEEALKENEQLYRTLFDKTDDAFEIVEPLLDERGKACDFRFLKTNLSFEAQSGLKTSEIIGKTVKQVLPQIESYWLDYYDKVVKTGKSLRAENYNQDLNRWFDVIMFPYGSGKVGVLFRDITQRKKTENELKLNSQRVHEILESISDDFMVLDYHWNYIYANTQAANILGLQPSEIVGKNFWSLFPQNRGTFIERNLREAMEKRKIRRFEITGQYSNRVKIITAYPSIEGLALIATDITERKNLEKELKEKDRLAAVGATAGMVGHDIRNPLQAIMSDTYLLREELTSMPPCRTKAGVAESLDGIEKNITYINKIVADLQDYSKALTPESVNVNLYELVTSIFKPIAIADEVCPFIEIDSALELKTDPTLLTRILSNLIINAIQAMPQGGKLTIRALKTYGKVTISVEDTGVGIPDSVKPKLFTPMMTTKAKGQGLGLAVVKRLVEALNGTIGFQSQEGKGTTFIIEFPS